MKVRYYVFYRDLCTPKIKEFSDKKQMKNFIISFLLKYQDNEDYGIDMIFEGNISYLAETITK